LIRGPYGLQPIYTFGSGDILQLNGEIFGVIGEYEIDSTTYKRIIIPYQNAKKAQAAYDSLVKNLDQYIEVLDKNKFGFVFKDYSKKYGIVKFRKTEIDIYFNIIELPWDEPK